MFWVGLSQSTIRLCLAEEEAQDLQQHADQLLHTNISPLVLISLGMDIKEQQ